MQEARISSIVPYLALGVFILVAKFSVIALYANATPYWDQWDAEADNLYRPWLEGSLTWTDLIAPHNEHRIATTRLYALGLLELNGKVWKPIAEMQVNAALHVFAVLLLLGFLNKGLSQGYRTALFIFSAALFSIPFGWENTLAGFQSSFYFLLLFSFLFLWSMSACKTYTITWWLGVIGGVLCLFTLASGAITWVAGSVILSIRRFVAGDRNGVGISAIVMLVVVAVVAMYLTPNIAHHDALKATSLAELIRALAEIGSWPAGGIVAGKSGAAIAYKFLMAGLIIQVPLLIYAYRVFHSDACARSEPMFLLGMAVWVFGQFLSIAYGRAEVATSSRYQDLFAIGLVLNFAALLYLTQDRRSEQIRRYRVGIVIWVATVATGFSASAGQVSDELRAKGRQGIEQEKNVRAYLCTGDVSHLENKPLLFVPYPNSERLKNLLDNPTIRGILPGNIYANNSRQPIGKDGEPYCNQAPLVHAFRVAKWDHDSADPEFAWDTSVTQNRWQGTDFFRSKIQGFHIFGSFINSETDTGIITLQVSRGQKILYRSGSRVAGQFLLVNGSGPNKFYTALPLAIEWAILEFYGDELPDQFSVSLVDAGTKWGEWSAIALRSVDDR